MNTLEADSVTMNFDSRRILNGIYIKVKQGEIVGLLGRNGCGKSTLLKSIFGIIEPDHKTIRINGAWIKAGYVQSKIKMLPQSDFIPGNIKLRRALKLFDVDIARFVDAVPHLERSLDLSPQQLSGGDRRIAELLVIIYSKAEFCLLDEPFSGLSPVMVERVIEILRDVKKTKGILVTDHLYRSVIDCADRVYHFDNGRVKETSSHDVRILYSDLTSSAT